MSGNGTERECFKCGESIRPRLSAYKQWDEVFTLTWMPSSDDDEYVEVTDSNGKHPYAGKRVFCSRDCLESFIQMDYTIKPRSVDTDTEQ